SILSPHNSCQPSNSPEAFYSFYSFPKEVVEQRSEAIGDGGDEVERRRTMMMRKSRSTAMPITIADDERSEQGVVVLIEVEQRPDQSSSGRWGRSNDGRIGAAGGRIGATVAGGDCLSKVRGRRNSKGDSVAAGVGGLRNHGED
ncbi:hypothetical protein LINPERHAP2_LOCUS35515, partial [Linum perenne]